MPISEYDTLGSDSEATRDSPPTFAESAGLSHAHIHPIGGGRQRLDQPISHNRGSTDIFKHRVRSRQGMTYFLCDFKTNGLILESFPCEKFRPPRGLEPTTSSIPGKCSAY